MSSWRWIALTSAPTRMIIVATSVIKMRHVWLSVVAHWTSVSPIAPVKPVVHLDVLVVIRHFAQHFNVSISKPMKILLSVRRGLLISLNFYLVLTSILWLYTINQYLKDLLRRRLQSMCCIMQARRLRMYWRMFSWLSTKYTSLSMSIRMSGRMPMSWIHLHRRNNNDKCSHHHHNIYHDRGDN